jgi:hypothetical protein
METNPYYQYFTGGVYFEWELPCDASDLVHFRKRVGEKGALEIFQLSVDLHQSKEEKATQVLIDTTTHKAHFTKVLNQKKEDKDKIYSLHEPHTACIAKGKTHKPYEFGAKIGLATLPGSNVIVGIAHFLGNPHDSTTLEATLANAEALTSKTFKSAIVDRGYRGQTQIGKTTIVIPNPKKDEKLSQYHKSKKRKQCRSRAAIEPIISHLKHDYRMGRNYLKGIIGDKLNAILAVTAFNLKKSLNELFFGVQNLWLLFLITQLYICNKSTYKELILAKVSC